MADDHEEAQDYKANGPTDVGFRTGGDGTGIKNGVFATGTSVGVGIGVRGEANMGVGVFGDSEKSVGVFGMSRSASQPGVLVFASS